MFNFFSNNVIYVDGENTEVVRYPKDTSVEQKPRTIFYVPNHNRGTDNLLIFVDGNLEIIDRDYEDLNSSQIQFKRNIYPRQDVVAILIKGASQLEWGYF